MSDSATFQEIILQLTNFWKDQGCLVWHPHNVQVGAGTMNPATVLRVLGPEPWNVVYLEPSIRPDDGRFGENPNRMQQHYQIQVILKPDPGNPQELYLRSLESMGIDLDKHDIRFVEDNWEQPALGAWGLGWEVWLDGQEITQFTYFQQAGGVNLDPVSVEITYGMDRIVLAKQRVDSVWEIDFGSGTFYGDLLLQSEIEHCQYYFNVADVEALRKIYDAYEKEAIRCLDKGLVAPAHDFNLKCSFLFNVLDTRGAIGVTERAQFFRRMRKIAGQVSNLYLEQRLRLEYPFLENERWSAPVMDKSAQPVPKTVFSSPQSFVLEIGSEELPAADLESAVRQLELAAREMLDKLRLAYEKMEVQGTPRRLVLQVEALAPYQEDLETVVKGPPLDRAYDPAGVPTKAAEGFARSKGVRTSDLRIVTEGDRRYVAAAVREEGQPAVSLLPAELPSLIAALKFERSMRWNESNISYSRPIRWIVSLFGTQVLPFTYAGVASGRTSRGLRSDDSPDFEIQSASEYGDRLAEQGIMISQRMRQKKILESAATLASQVGGTVKDDSALLSEVANLVEMPTPLLAKFEKRFLALPDDVLVAVMKKHQRYLPVYDGSGEALLPYFIAVRNGGDSHLDIIRDGNEHVIRARFSDAAYFFERDSEQDMAHFLSKLDTLTFQVEVGSMLEKVQRLEKLTSDIADLLEFDEDDKAAAVRAAALSKADLASSLVVEMTSLQGIMGGIYSDMAGEVPAVSQAIAEQYNTISGTNPGLALALSDRVDSLAGLFAAGLAPKGSNDPFALRRAAIQIIENLTANQKSLDLRQALHYAAAYLPLGVTEETLEEVLEFISSRLQTFLQEQGLRTSVVRSVLAQQAHNPYAAATAAKELDEAIKTDAWPQLLDAYSRCVRITRDTESHELNLELFVTEEEKQLWSTYVEASAILDGSVSGLVEAIELLEPAISRFFDGVLVMDDNLDIRQNRLALLQKIAGMTDGIADLSHLEGF